MRGRWTMTAALAGAALLAGGCGSAATKQVAHDKAKVVAAQRRHRLTVAAGTFTADTSSLYIDLSVATSSGLSDSSLSQVYADSTRMQTDLATLKPLLPAAQRTNASQLDGSLGLLEKGIAEYQAGDFYTANADIENALALIKSAHLGQLVGSGGGTGD